MFFPFLCIGIFPSSSLPLKSFIFLFILTQITGFWASPIPSSKASNNYFAPNPPSPEDEEFVSFSLPARSGASSSLSLLFCSGAVCFARLSREGKATQGGGHSRPAQQSSHSIRSKIHLGMQPGALGRLPRGFGKVSGQSESV